MCGTVGMWSGKGVIVCGIVGMWSGMGVIMFLSDEMVFGNVVMV